MPDELEIAQAFVMFGKSIAEIYSSLSEQSRTIQTILMGMQALVLTAAELDPRFHETYNRFLEQAEKSANNPPERASRLQEIEAHLAALKKRGGGKIQ